MVAHSRASSVDRRRPLRRRPAVADDELAKRLGELAEQDLADVERQIRRARAAPARSSGQSPCRSTMRSSEKRGTRAPRIGDAARRQASAVPTSPIAAETARDRNGRLAMAICIASPRVATMSTSSLSRMTGECSATISATGSVSPASVMMMWCGACSLARQRIGEHQPHLDRRIVEQHGHRGLDLVALLRRESRR